ncbi:hypothetical protein B9Z19DRAFT_1127014 [Tuber borchii]|uniref:Uncharacterized protein n=1 Tax=Tuber borchii TaxID=42251 RepID=A0A2T6ZS59_TUBBO|nr:hypothetical protein B9Z19DRAFT_1127014 [Tuber borchii]
MAAQILAQIHSAFKARSCESLTFSELDPSVSAEILKNLLGQKDTRDLGLRIHFIAPDGYLRIVMASRLHETAVTWMRMEYGLWICHGLLTPSAVCSISDSLSLYDTFVGTFENCKKTPDLCYSPMVNGVMTEFPTIVLESGWLETEAQLKRDSQLWLQGSAGAVRVVFLFKLFHPNVRNEIKATLHVCRLVNNDIDMDTYNIFPAPAEDIAIPSITAEELFRGQYPYGVGHDTVFALSLGGLRYLCGEEIRAQGHLPMA